MEPIRILHVLAGLDRGGAEAMLMNLYRKVDKSNVQFDFVVNNYEGEYAFEKEVIELGGRVYRLPKYILTNHMLYKKSWESLLIKHPEWKIIHAHHTVPAFIYLNVAKKLKRRCIVHSHIAGGEKTLKSQIKVLMRYPLRHRADYLFACSELAAKWMFGKYCSSAKIINNSIDAKKFSYNENIRLNKRKEIGLDDKFVVGHIGNFRTQKNHDFLIDIFKNIHSNNKKAVLVLVGDGELRGLIEQKVKSLGIEKSVIFTGARPDIPELLQTMDVFLFPSLYEGLPVVMIEAQASGMRCVISDSITTETKLTNLVEFISLNKPSRYWAEQVLKHSLGYKRQDKYDVICKRGYDVELNASWLENFYLEEYNGHA